MFPYAIYGAFVRKFARVACTAVSLMTNVPLYGQEHVTWIYCDDMLKSHTIESTIAKLGQSVTIRVENTPLKDVLAKLPVPFRIDDKALEEENISAEEPISINSKSGESVLSVLRAILERLQLTWVPYESYLLITSKQSSANMNCIYDVTSLVRSAKESKEQGKFDFGQLRDLIERAIAQDSWVSAGGTSELIEYRDTQRGLLVVVAPIETHMELQGMLRSLERMRESRRFLYHEGYRLDTPSIRRSNLQSSRLRRLE